MKGIKEFKLNDPKRMRAWAMYDWANSAFQLTITSTIFPIYYQNVTSLNNAKTVDFFGIEIINSVLYSYTISFSFLFIAFLSPILSGIADYTGLKKMFMRFFTLLGSFACVVMYFFDANNVELGIIAFGLSIIGYAGSLVFYNSFIPQIVTSDKMDKLSALGYSYGYIGSVILLIINLAVVFFHDKLHISETMALKLAFVSVGVWWIGFSSITFKYLPRRSVFRDFSSKILFNGFRELVAVFKKFWSSKDMKIFLIGFFIYSTAVQTIMYMAVLFGKEIQVPDDHLIGIVLILQLIAIPGAMFFAWLSKRIGNIYTLIFALIIWGGIVIGGYYTTSELHFIILALFVGLLMGGTQSLSRSTYSKLIPAKEKNTASFFSFYEFIEKVSIVLGTGTFGLLISLTGDMRNSFTALLLYFLISISFLFFIRKNNMLKSYK